MIVAETDFADELLLIYAWNAPVGVKINQHSSLFQGFFEIAVVKFGYFNFIIYHKQETALQANCLKLGQKQITLIALL